MKKFNNNTNNVLILNQILQRWKTQLRQKANPNKGEWTLGLFINNGNPANDYHPEIFSDKAWDVNEWAAAVRTHAYPVNIAYAETPEDLLPSPPDLMRISMCALWFVVFRDDERSKAYRGYQSLEDWNLRIFGNNLKGSIEDCDLNDDKQVKLAYRRIVGKIPEPCQILKDLEEAERNAKYYRQRLECFKKCNDIRNALLE